MDGTKIPLVTAAAELCVDATELARRIADQITVDTSTGLRVIPASICRDLIAQKAAQAAARAEQQRTRRDEIAKRTNETRERVRGLQAKQQIPVDDGDLAASALATVLSGRDYERHMERVGERNAAYLRGESHGATFPGGLRQE